MENKINDFYNYTKAMLVYFNIKLKDYTYIDVVHEFYEEISTSDNYKKIILNKIHYLKYKQLAESQLKNGIKLFEKKCCSCKQIKHHDEFRLLYDKRTGLHYKTTRCNKCSVEYTKKYYENNEFYRERAKQRSRDWYHANKDRYNQWRINRKNNSNAGGNE